MTVPMLLLQLLQADIVQGGSIRGENTSSILYIAEEESICHNDTTT